MATPQSDQPGAQTVNPADQDASHSVQEEAKKKVMMIPKLSIRDFEMPIEKVVKQLFGVKVEPNEYTKELERIA